MTHEYQVEVERDGRWWMIHVPELDELTQARRLGEVEQMARELVAVSTGTPISDVAVRVTKITIDDIDVASRAQKVVHDRRLAERYSAAAQAEAKRLARDLADRGVPVRDVGEVLGVSFQRAQQLISA